MIWNLCCHNTFNLSLLTKFNESLLTFPLDVNLPKSSYKKESDDLLRTTAH